MIVACVAAIAMQPLRQELPAWAHRLDLAIDDRPIDARPGLGAAFKAVPPKFTIAGFFPKGRLAGEMKIRLGDRPSASFLKKARKIDTSEKFGTTQYKTSLSGDKQNFAVALVNRSGRLHGHTLTMQGPDEGSDALFKDVNSAFRAKLGRPTEFEIDKKSRMIWAVWKWSDGSSLDHFIDFPFEGTFREEISLGLPPIKGR